MTPAIPRLVAQRGSVAAGALPAAALVLALAACGPTSTTASAAGPSPAPTQSTSARGGSSGGAGYGGPGGVGGFGGASGLVADVTGSTLQVQDPRTGQTAITFTPSTVWQQVKSVRSSALAVGDCVVVVSTTAPTARPTAAPSAASIAPAPVGPLTARSVQISAGQGGQCGPGRGFAGARPGSNASPRPGFTSDRQGGAQGNRPGGRGIGFAEFGAVGEVTAVSPGGFTVEQTRRGPAGSSANAGTTTSPTTVQVTTTSSTTWTQTVAATSSAATVGVCVAAVGPADDTGAVTARSITVSQPVAGSCTQGGFGGFGGFGRFRSAGGQGGDPAQGSGTHA